MYTLPRYNEICDLFGKYGVSSASLFGSRVFGDNRTNSDYDILVEFTPQSKTTFFGMIELAQKLEDILGHKVDLVTRRGLSPYIREDIIKSAKPIYGKKS